MIGVVFASMLFALPYGLTFAWKFLLFCPLFLIFGIKVFFVRFGFNFNYKSAIFYVIATLCLFNASKFAIDDATKIAGLQTINSYSFLWVISPVFQTLHEEFALRVLILKYTVRFGPLISAIILALIFALSHFLLYGFGFEKVKLEFSVLLTLFSFGLGSNLLFIKENNFLLPFLFHLCWNLNRFRNLFLHDNKLLKEGNTFNLIEGSPLVLALSLGFLSFSIIFYLFNAGKILPGIELIKKVDFT